jgi:hypothetical protein
MGKRTFIDFLQALKPWLSDNYIQHARFDEDGNFTLTFTGVGQKVYQVDGCTAGQAKDALELLKTKDVKVFD